MCQYVAFGVSELANLKKPFENVSVWVFYLLSKIQEADNARDIVVARTEGDVGGRRDLRCYVVLDNNFLI